MSENEYAELDFEDTPENIEASRADYMRHQPEVLEEIDDPETSEDIVLNWIKTGRNMVTIISGIFYSTNPEIVVKLLEIVALKCFSSNKIHEFVDGVLAVPMELWKRLDEDGTNTVANKIVTLLNKCGRHCDDVATAIMTSHYTGALQDMDHPLFQRGLLIEGYWKKEHSKCLEANDVVGALRVITSAIKGREVENGSVWNGGLACREGKTLWAGHGVLTHMVNDLYSLMEEKGQLANVQLKDCAELNKQMRHPEIEKFHPLLSIFLDRNKEGSYLEPAGAKLVAIMQGVHKLLKKQEKSANARRKYQERLAARNLAQ